MDDSAKMVDAASDERTVNNDVRHQYRVLSDAEKATMTWLKDTGQSFITHCDELAANNPAIGREMSLAKTKMQEAVMWAVNGITK